MLNKFKSMAIEGFIKNKYPQYFENKNLSVSLNVDEKTCIVDAQLAGESTVTKIDIAKFEIVKNADGNFLKIIEASSDKKWINCMLKDFIENKEIKIPSIVADSL